MLRRKQCTIGEIEEIIRRYQAGDRPKAIGASLQRDIKTIYTVLWKRNIRLRGPQKVKRLTEPKPQVMPEAKVEAKPAGEFGLPIAPGLFDSAAAARARMMAGR